MDFKFGKLPATKLVGVGYADDYALGRPLTPPVEFPTPKPRGGFPILGNDVCGDCTIAGAAHVISAVDSEIPFTQQVQFTTEQAIAQYEFFTGYNPQTGANDTGCNENDVLETWRTKGLFKGHKILAHAPVQPHDILAVHRAIAFYGVCYIGIACPESAQQQFAAGDPWTVVPGSPVVGGHCIVAVGYTPAYIECATWGGIAAVSWPFWETYCDEAHVVITGSEVRAGHGVGKAPLDTEALVADLDRLAV